MKEITEDYVSIETARLLNEKGFNEECWNYYYKSKQVHYFRPVKNTGWTSDKISAPTLQMAIKWLREVHNICISVDVKIGGGKYYVCISSTENGLSHDVLEDEVWDTYEEACEAAIKYCLENLI